MTLKKALALAIGITVSGGGAAFAGSAPLSDAEMDMVSAQGIQSILNQGGSEQSNNLDSVQLNGSAQANSTVLSLVNSSGSSVNSSANLLSGFEMSTSGVIQENTNTAENHVNKAVSLEEYAFAENINNQSQNVNNDYFSDIDGQENNNNSVQLNGYAQRNSKGVSVMNAAFSAANFGLNIFSSEGDGILAGSVTQTNTQNAFNMGNTADAGGSDAYAQNFEDWQVTQTVINGESSWIDGQNNNHNSVQLNGSAQQKARVDSLVNSAMSATNTAANMATAGDLTFSDVYQANTSRAENHVNDAFALFGDAIAENLDKQTQNIENGEFALVLDQENNSSSVQLNDYAQQGASAALMENSASSAVNSGLNLLNAGGQALNDDNIIEQKNIQAAWNFNNYADGGAEAEASNWEQSTNPGQHISNLEDQITTHQNNNNNSVQMNGSAQQNITADKAVNSANSAVNVGQNLLNWYSAGGDIADSVINQANTQEAKNHYNDAFAFDEAATAENKYKQIQLVDNYFTTDLSQGTQNNNMNSVQLNGCAQQYATAAVLINSASSAVNVGSNIIRIGSTSNTYVTQSNTNTAVNFSNFADGGTSGYAANRN